MPVFAVNSEGVSLAMSFICGLSTMATLIEPPFVPDAGVPLALEPEELLLLDEPPQPVARTLTTSTRAAAARTIVLLISLPLRRAEGRGVPPRWVTYNVGLCWLSRPNAKYSNMNQLLCRCLACV